MKQLFILSAALLLAVSAQAQEFKPFKVNVSLGAALPSGGGGLLFAVEPKYGVSDRIDVGLRLELAAMARSVVNNGYVTTGDVTGAASYLLTGNYLLSDNNFRPFVGAGVGIFGIAGTSFAASGNQSSNGEIKAGNAFGGMVRAGFKTGHFVLGVEYNLVPSTTAALYDSNGNVKVGSSVQSKNSYLGVKLGFDIGGGRR